MDVEPTFYLPVISLSLKSFTHSYVCRELSVSHFSFLFLDPFALEIGAFPLDGTSGSQITYSLYICISFVVGCF